MRPITAALSICVLAHATGCATGFERARAHSREVLANMTRGEVMGRIGGPDRWWPESSSAERAETWGYQYGPGAGWWTLIALIGLPVIPALILVGWPFWWPGPTPFPSEAFGGVGWFHLRFGADGRVMQVSDGERGELPRQRP